MALQKCGEVEMGPLTWLQEVWLSLVTLVINRVAEVGKTADQNDIGDVSVTEAKKVLIECGGDIQKSIAVCVEERKKKVRKSKVAVQWISLSVF